MPWDRMSGLSFRSRPAGEESRRSIASRARFLSRRAGSALQRRAVPARGRTVAAATPTLPPAPVESESRTPNPYPRAPTPVPFSSQGASNGRWSTLNRKVVNFEQTGALWRLIVIMAVPEEIRFVVPLMRTREKRAISIYRAQTASCSSLFIGGLKR